MSRYILIYVRGSLKLNLYLSLSGLHQNHMHNEMATRRADSASAGHFSAHTILLLLTLYCRWEKRAVGGKDSALTWEISGHANERVIRGELKIASHAWAKKRFGLRLKCEPRRSRPPALFSHTVTQPRGATQGEENRARKQAQPVFYYIYSLSLFLFSLARLLACG